MSVDNGGVRLVLVQAVHLFLAAQRLSVCLCVIVCEHVFTFTSIRWNSPAATAGRTSPDNMWPWCHRVVLYMWKWNLGSLSSGNISDLYLSLTGIGRLLLRLWWKKLFYWREVYGECTELWLWGNAWPRGQGGGPSRVSPLSYSFIWLLLLWIETRLLAVAVCC